jgi:hypothetical protein
MSDKSNSGTERCERCEEEKKDTATLYIDGRSWATICEECHDILAMEVVEPSADERCVECGKDLTDPKNCGDPDVGGDWVCADDDCRIMHEPEMAVQRRVIRDA